MADARPATIALRERDRWVLVLDSAFCLIRAIFSLDQIGEHFQGTANEIAGLSILASLVIVTITGAVLTSRGGERGARLRTFALLLAVVSLCWELLWTWLHVHSIAYGDIGVTWLLVPARLLWNGIYAAVLTDTHKAS